MRCNAGRKMVDESSSIVARSDILTTVEDACSNMTLHIFAVLRGAREVGQGDFKGYSYSGVEPAYTVIRQGLKT